MIILLCGIYAIIAFVQGAMLIRKKYWREFWICSVLLVVAFMLNLMQVLNVKIPSPMVGVHYIVNDVLQLNY
ncbi:hypothetical protein [Sporomusa sp. KB1]|jgi:hypothetical protein|uniref:hypothetical protein n=1 Tax=Sporomusa sp. KB1 TaxID=943346 RepID=UPI0011A7F7FA|nr:hypothetical protein [Sporomusa sp. KB1]TWH48452.1 hypothetical protein Salpa_4606 [Sporomusa sp. KB1]